jgi:hypothetical protein
LLIDLGKLKNTIAITDIIRKKHGKTITNGKNMKIYKQTVAACLKAVSQNSPGESEEDQENPKSGYPVVRPNFLVDVS